MKKILVLSVLSSCGPQPKVEDTYLLHPKIEHASFKDSCIVCHESQRLGPSAGIAHGLGGDCGVCHQALDDSVGTIPWQALPYEHVPQEACLGCHGHKRPARSTHIQVGDCTSCHQFPSWKSGKT